MNYWKMKTDELLNLLEEREIVVDEEDKKSRKFIINLLKIDDLDKGNSSEVLTFNEKDEIVELVSERIPKKEVRVKQPEKEVIPDNAPYRGMKMMKCFFKYSSDNEPGYVQLGHNGRCYYIPKDVEVTIPAFLKCVIDDAVIDKMETITIDGKPHQRITKVPRINYEFRGYVD